MVAWLERVSRTSPPGHLRRGGAAPLSEYAGGLVRGLLARRRQVLEMRAQAEERLRKIEDGPNGEDLERHSALLLRTAQKLARAGGTGSGWSPRGPVLPLRRAQNSCVPSGRA